MDTQRLATFLAVVETGSMSAAADQLGYAQSSVSEQVRRLESEFGAALLERGHSGVALTQAGTSLLEHARFILAAISRARAAVSGAADVLQVGALDTLAAEWLPDVLRLHRELSADPSPVQITTQNRASLLTGLRERRLDLVFLYETSEQPEATDEHTNLTATHKLHRMVVDRDELVLVAAPDLAATINPTHTGAGLHAAPWLITEQGCTYRALFEQHIRSQNLDVSIAAQTVGLAALRRLAAHGEGIALLPSLAAEPELRRGELTAIPHCLPIPQASITAVWCGAEPPPTAQALIRRATDKGTRRTDR